MTMTAEQINEQHNEVDLEMKRLNLELMQEQVQAMHQKKETRRQQLQKQQEDLEANDRIKAAREANCKHKKGGRNKEGLDRGNSSDYAVIQNTYPWGAVQVMCQRCGATWDNPPIELKATDPEKYFEQLRKYRIALDWPTDNEPSGTQIFLITRNEVPTGRAPKEPKAPKMPKAPAAKRTRVKKVA